jgi:hypothetical protein
MITKLLKWIKSMIAINNKEYQGNNINIINGKIYIDNKLINTENDKTINIEIFSSIEMVTVDYCNNITIQGDCQELNSKNGNISANIISGNATTKNGNITANTIHGNATTKNGNISK